MNSSFVYDAFLSFVSLLREKRAKSKSTLHNFSVSLYLRLRRRFREKGFTIVEMMIVVALIGLLSAVSISLISLLFQSNIRAAQTANQQSNIETFYGFLASRLSYVERSDMGVPIGNATPEQSTLRLEKSLAPDQMMFTFKDDLLRPTCYRIMYFRQRQEIRVVSHPLACEDSNSPLVPKRRPNETFSGTKTSDGFAAPTNPLFDPAIDSASTSWSTWLTQTGTLTDQQKQIQTFSLVAGVRNGGSDFYGTSWPPSYPETYPKVAFDVFSYWADAAQLAASAGSIDIASLRSVRVQSFQGPYAGSAASVPDRFYEQRFFVGQLCPIDTSSGSSGGGTSTPVTLDNLPNAPGVDLRISQTTQPLTGTSFNPVQFAAGDFSNGTFWSAAQPTEINIPEAGIYTVSVNMCFADNSATDETAGFILQRESGSTTAPILQTEIDFTGVGAEERCLSATRTLSFSAGNKIRLTPTRTNNASGSNISLIWESRRSS